MLELAIAGGRQEIVEIILSQSGENSNKDKLIVLGIEYERWSIISMMLNLWEKDLTFGNLANVLPCYFSENRIAAVCQRGDHRNSPVLTRIVSHKQTTKKTAQCSRSSTPEEEKQKTDDAIRFFESSRVLVTWPSFYKYCFSLGGRCEDPESILSIVSTNNKTFMKHIRLGLYRFVDLHVGETYESVTVHEDVLMCKVY